MWLFTVSELATPFSVAPFVGASGLMSVIESCGLEKTVSEYAPAVNEGSAPIEPNGGEGETHTLRHCWERKLHLATAAIEASPPSRGREPRQAASPLRTPEGR